MAFWQLNTAATDAIAADRTALKALDTSKYQSAFLTEDGRSGLFVFRNGNYSSFVTADTMEGIYVKATDTASSAGAWVRVYSGSANVKWFGAMGDNCAADLASLQAATDLCDAVFIPNGTYKINGPWLLDDHATLNFESVQALSSVTDSASAILRARGGSSYRNFYIRVNSGMLQGPTAGTGLTGIDFLPPPMAASMGLSLASAATPSASAGPGL